MTPFYSKEKEEIRQQVRAFAEKEIKPIAAELDEIEMFSVELSQKMGQAGLYGMDIPQKYGGRGLDTLSYIIAVEELARIDSSQAVTMCAHNSLGVAPIYNFGTKEQKEELLPNLLNGSKLWAFGLTEENAGSDARGVDTVASKTKAGWVINGKKRYITNGSNSLLAGLTVMAKTGERDGKPTYSTFLLPRETEGFTTQRMFGKMMWRASDTSEITLKNCVVRNNDLLGEENKGLSQILKTLDSGRLSIAAMGLGLAQGAFEMALKYAKERKQFGKAIGSFQSIQFKLADMDMKIELARNTLYKACWLKDNQQPFSKEAAMAKLYCSEIAGEISDDAVQIFGGAGLFKNKDIERFYRDHRILRIGEGTTEILKMVISRHLGL
ncbi:acyl-CoA dehydrogenase family protein [Plebeiibacterium marinum]|uniref:Acyl-CoA dehydrogenase family protein n=1 Tax=Plebeiibacterium marinum TaxID=2992111 RepID=A0AAE3MDV7_9BACT|nr:acyl-CoA dehydrogenase family protein [Plebeiobacterium marinum]MCW3805782.1 acyl-CoA dehydrogenase family protein [Plebeiobacterium marinum]